MLHLTQSYYQRAGWPQPDGLSRPLPLVGERTPRLRTSGEVNLSAPQLSHEPLLSLCACVPRASQALAVAQDGSP